ncbi:MAG: 30S ribosomal protein S4 [Candidatus Woesearchaeota archaeon]
MGDPRKHRKKFIKPSHPWQKQRLETEGAFIKEYGLKNKKEIWKAQAKLRHYASLAKNLVRESDQESIKESEQLVLSLHKMGILPENGTINDILSLTEKDIFERRLQTQVVRKGLARTFRQARQFITHGHVTVNNKSMRVPSYLVRVDEEVGFSPLSTLKSEDHPERTVEIKEE